MGHLVYRERLEELGLYSMYGRLLRADLIKIWKIFNGGLVPEMRELFEMATHPATRGHPLKLSIPRHRLEIRKRFFSVRCIGIWNMLPSSIVLAESLEQFKGYIDKHLSSRFYSAIDDQ